MVRRILLGIVGGALLGPGPAAADLVEKEFTHVFPVERNTLLRVEHGDGDVILTPWDREEVDVIVRYRAEETKVGFGNRPEMNVAFEEGEGIVQVIERRSGGVTIGYQSRKILEYSYTIRAPSHLAVELEGDDGNVRIRGWRGEIQLELEDGDVELEDVQSPRTQLLLEDGDAELLHITGELVIDCEDGDVTVTGASLPRARLRSEDGNLVIRETTGNLHLEVEDGDVRLTQVRAGNLEVRSGDGDVDLDLRSGEPLALNVRAEDGSVHVNLEPGMSAAFSLRAAEGSITVELPGARNITEREGRVSGQLGEGRGEIYIQTDGGNITLRESGPMD